MSRCGRWMSVSQAEGGIRFSKVGLGGKGSVELHGYNQLFLKRFLIQDGFLRQSNTACMRTSVPSKL